MVPVEHPTVIPNDKPVSQNVKRIAALTNSPQATGLAELMKRAERFGVSLSLFLALSLSLSYT
jgi:hypothetical protein